MPKPISPRDLSARLSAGDKIYLLDVRQPEEHAHAKINGSALIPLPELMGRVGELDEADNSQIVVYCHHGVRSVTGGLILERAGHKDVLSLAGGIDAWSAEIDPTVPRY